MDIILFPVISADIRELPFYITSIGMHDSQNHIIRTLGHEDYHYLHTCSGSGKLTLNGNDFILTKGMGFISDPQIPHEYYPLEKPWKTSWITFKGFAAEKFTDLIYDNQKVFFLNSAKLLDDIHNDMQILALSHGRSNYLECSGLLYSFLIALKNNICDINSSLNQDKENKLAPVLNYLDNNYSKYISLDTLANLINVTPQHLCRLFKQSFHMRPFEFLTHLRINKSKELLLMHESYSIKEISFKVGFTDTSYFSSTFKEYAGCTPKEFKSRYKNSMNN